MPGSSFPQIASVSEHISGVFGVLAEFRDEEVAGVRSLHAELLGAGRVDSTLALRRGIDLWLQGTGMGYDLVSAQDGYLLTRRAVWAGGARRDGDPRVSAPFRSR
jgi:hypothetical protein